MKHWYVVRSKHRDEVLLWHQLCSRGIEVYLPRVSTMSMKRRPGTVQPLFPGYVFVRVDLGAGTRSALQWMPGASGFVCFGGKPAFISDCMLRKIQQCADGTKRPVRCAASGGDPGGADAGAFACYGGLFDPDRSDRERVMAFLRLIRDQQLLVHWPTAQSVLTRPRGVSAATRDAFGPRRSRFDAPPSHHSSYARHGNRARLEAPREEGPTSS